MDPTKVLHVAHWYAAEPFHLLGELRGLTLRRKEFSIPAFTVVPEAGRDSQDFFELEGRVGCNRCFALNYLVNGLPRAACPLSELGLGHSKRVQSF
jgi:hypothetical protein